MEGERWRRRVKNESRGKWHACRGGKRQMEDRRAKRSAMMKMRKWQAALMKEECRVGMFAVTCPRN